MTDEVGTLINLPLEEVQVFAGMEIDKLLRDGEWWDPNVPKPAAAAPAAK